MQPVSPAPPRSAPATRWGCRDCGGGPVGARVCRRGASPRPPSAGWQPLLALLWALPRGPRERVGAWVRRPRVVGAWHRVTAPLAVLVLQLVVLAVWHLRGPFELALRHDGIHAVQHLMFFLVAALFWW